MRQAVEESERVAWDVEKSIHAQQMKKRMQAAISAGLQPLVGKLNDRHLQDQALRTLRDLVRKELIEHFDGNVEEADNAMRYLRMTLVSEKPGCLELDAVFEEEPQR